MFAEFPKFIHDPNDQTQGRVVQNAEEEALVLPGKEAGELVAAVGESHPLALKKAKRLAEEQA